MKVTYLHFDFQSQPRNCRLLLTSETYIRVLMALHLRYKKNFCSDIWSDFVMLN